MCGFAGLVNIAGTLIEKEEFRLQLSKAGQYIAHRGPDDASEWIDTEGRVGLSFRRLAIIDLSLRGRQPMLDDEGNAIVYNGEVYNFAALRKQLPGVSMKSDTDTEVVLNLISRRGPAAISELDGMFAFAHYSVARQEIVLAVDPAGEKPLYTYWDGKYFAFASEIKALKAFPSLQFETEVESLKEALICGYTPAPYTLYRHIRKLLPGHYQVVRLKNGPHPVRPYWELPKDTAKIAFPEALEELERLFSEAVRKRLIADVPIGCFLSGGLDSSAVVYEAAKVEKAAQVKTFSIGFSTDLHSKFYDESKYAERVAARIGTSHTTLQLEANQLNSAGILEQFDEPFGDSSAIPMYFLSRETARYVTVALSGDGGDELFGGYLRFRAALISERYKSLCQLFFAPFNLKKASPRSFLGRVERFRSALDLPLLPRLILWNSFFSEGELEKAFFGHLERFRASIEAWDRKTEGFPIGEKILHFNYSTYLFNDLLPKVDRMSMAHSLEVRAPFLDRALTEFAFRLPTSYKFDAFHTKKILKTLYGKKIGKDITNRAKHGFAFPLESFLPKLTRSSVSPLDKFFSKSSTELLHKAGRNRLSKDFLLLSLERCLQ